MPTLQEVLADPNYVNANFATKQAIFNKYASQDPNYSQANDATRFAIRQKYGVETPVVQEEAVPTAKPIPQRTYGEAAKDVGGKFVSGIGSLVQLPGQLYGLATGDFSKTGLLGAGEDIKKYGEEMLSPALKAKEEARAQKVQEAEKTGQIAAGATAFGETIKDPALLVGFLVEQIPQIIPALLTGGGTAALTAAGITAREAAALVASGAAKEAAQVAAKQIAAKKAGELGVKAAVGTGAVQQGADIGAGAYENIYKEAIAQGMSEPEAAQKALGLARAAGASGALISLLAQRLPGARTLEEAFAGVPGKTGRILGAGKGALGESVSEMVEEGGGKFSQNLAMREVNPEQDLFAGVGQAAGMAAIGGGGMGAIAGAARRPGTVETLPPAAPPTGQGTPPPPPATPPTETAPGEPVGVETLPPADQGIPSQVEIPGAVAPTGVETLPPAEAPPVATPPEPQAAAPVEPEAPEFVPSETEQTKPRGVEKFEFTPEEKQEIKEVQAALVEVNKEIKEAQAEKGSLFRMLKGSLVERPGAFSLADIDKDKKSLRQLYSASGQGVLLEDMVADGTLDAFLPTENRSDNENFDAQAAIEHIAGKLRNGDYRTEEAAAKLEAAQNKKAQIQDQLEKLKAVPSINLELGEMAEQPKDIAPEVSLSDLEEEARSAGVDIDALKEDLDANMPKATPAEYQGAYRSALFAATSGSQSYTIGENQYTIDEIATYISEGFTEDEINELIAQAEAQQADAIKNSSVIKPQRKTDGVAKIPPKEEKPTVDAGLPAELPEPKDFVAKKSMEEIAAEIKGMTATQLAQWAVDNAPNSAAKAVAEKVLVRIKELDDRNFFNKPVTVLNRDDLSYRGIFSYAINLSAGNLKFAGLKNGKAHRGTGTRYITILHELLHAATVPLLSARGKEYNDLTVVLDKVKKQIAADKRAGKQHPIFDAIAQGANTVQNVKELISWGLTYPDFQDYLKTVKVGNTNALIRLVEIFRKFLGIDAQYETALDAVVRAADTLLETPTEVTEKAIGRSIGTKKVAPPAAAKPAAKAPPKLTAPKGFKLKEGRNEQVVLAARELKAGNITKQQYDEYVNYYTPIGEILGDKLETPINDDLMRLILVNKIPQKKDPKLVNATVADGTKVGLRMDIPALEWGRANGVNGSVVSIHEGKPATNAAAGKNISYKSAGFLKNAVFAIRSEEKAFGIAQMKEGRAGQKAPQQTIEGTWVNMTPDEIFKMVKEKMKDPAWSQVSLDPLRHSFFYDRSNTKPVVSADEVLQVGRFVLAKNVKYAPREEFLYEDVGKEQVEEESLGDKLKAKVSTALQKRKPLSPTSFQDVPPDFLEKANPIFAPQRKTIVERIEEMRDRFWQRLSQGIADQFRTIKEYSEDAYILARMSKTVDGALEGLMFFGQVFNDGGALNIKQGTKGMIEVLKPLGNEVDRYQMWVALNREADLPANKRSNIDNLDELVSRRDELSAGEIDGKPREQVYKAVRTEMNKLNRSVLKVALDAGLIDSTANAIDRLRDRINVAQNNENLSDAKREKEIEELEAQIEELQKNPIGYERFIADINYIPFYREMEDGDVSKVMTSSGLSNQHFSKALEGGVSPFADLMENTLRNWSHILSASMKNQAAAASLTAAEKLGGAEPNLKVPYYIIDGKVYYRSNDEMVGDGSVKSWMTESGKGTVKAMVDGQPVYYQVLDPLLLDSITSIGYMGPKSKFLDVARGFKNVLQFGVTISPAFKIRNLFRDSISAMAVSDLKKNPFANVVNGWALSNKDNPAHMSALAGGALFNFGSIVEGDQAALVKRLIKMGVKEEHILDTPAKIKNQLKKAWDKYQEFGNKSESANRMALYQQMKDKGYGHLEASYYARDLLDFSMQGSWPAFRLLTQVIPFLNARTQGLYKLGRDGINPTVRVFYNSITGKPIEQTDRQKAESFGIVTGAVCLASLALYFAFKDDEEFKKRDEWDRDNFWWFKLPGMEYALRIPKPFEIGAFGTLAERTAEQIFDEGSEGKQFEQSLKRMITDTFAVNLPQFFKPLVDLYANKDSFTGAPIESAGMERLSKQERATDTTSPLAIALGGLTKVLVPGEGLSPVQVDYAIKAYFGWLGGTIAETSHYAVMPFKDGAYPDTKWVDKVSVGFIKSLPANQARYATAFYENNKEISQAYADMRHYAEIGDSAKVLKILEEKQDKIGLAKFYDKTAKNMAKVRLQIRMITNDTSMDGATKREEIDRLKELISMMAQQAEETRKSMK
jgi:hypothetical protein